MAGADEIEGIEATGQLPQEVPAWALEPLDRGIEYLKKEHELLSLAVRGIGSLSAADQAAEALAAHDELVRDREGKELSADEQKKAEERIEHARALARLAQREVADGFPLLYAHSSVAIWAGLETAMVDLVAAWLSNRNDALESEELQKVRVPLASFVSLDHEERIRLLVAELDRRAGASLRSGASRFEHLLDPIGLSGSVPEDVRAELFELQQVRNVVVHRAGLADRRFVESCASWNLKVGDLVTIDHRRHGRFFAAAVWYAVVVRGRIRETFGAATKPIPELPLSTDGA